MQPDKPGIPRIAKSMGHEIIGRKQSSEEFHRSPPAIELRAQERRTGPKVHRTSRMFSYFAATDPSSRMARVTVSRYKYSYVSNIFHSSTTRCDTLHKM